MRRSRGGGVPRCGCETKSASQASVSERELAACGEKCVRAANHARKRRIPLDGPGPTTLQNPQQSKLAQKAASGIKILVLAAKTRDLCRRIPRVDGLHRNRKTGDGAPGQDADIDTKA